MFRIALIIAFLAGLAAEAGQVYKWVDEDGNVHYSDQAPPEGQEAEELILDSTPSAADVRDAQERLDTLKTKSMAWKQKKRLQRCIYARQSLAAPDSKLIPIPTRGITKSYLATEKVAKEISRFQAEIDKFCD